MGQMATPPSSPPPPPPIATTSQSPSTLKRTRKVTRLRSLATRPIRAERPLVHVDLATGKVDVPHRNKLRTYLGIFARDKDLIREDIKAEFDILEAFDLRTKKKILQTVGERWRQFKFDLTSKWALAADKESIDDTVCEKYDISKEKWAQFCQTRRDPSWKAQAIQKQNTAPHVLSRGGYEYLENKLMEEKKKKKAEEAAQIESTDTVIDPPSPIRQHDSLEEQTLQGSFVAHGRQDVLTTAIGVTIKQYFGPTPRTSCMSSSMAPEDLEQVTQNIRDQLEESITKKGLALPPEPDIGPSATRVSTKESCVDPLGNDLDTGDSDKCELYVEENPPRLVSLGRHCEGSTTIHNIPLLHDQVKGAVGPAKPANRLDNDIDDPLYLMTLTIPQLFLKPL
ncbi:hypothetical protein HKD37_01G001427 [Glycine soja]